MGLLPFQQTLLIVTRLPFEGFVVTNKGAVHGKHLLWAVTTGGGESHFEIGAHPGFDVLSQPLQATAIYCGLNWLPPFAMQRRAAMTVSPAVGENFIDPKFEERRNAVPLHRVLPDDQIGARQRLLLGGNIDIEVRIELIKRANFDAFQRPCLFKHPFIRMGMMRIRMRINYKNHR